MVEVQAIVDEAAERAVDPPLFPKAAVDMRFDSSDESVARIVSEYFPPIPELETLREERRISSLRRSLLVVRGAVFLDFLAAFQHQDESQRLAALQEFLRTWAVPALGDSVRA